MERLQKFREELKPLQHLQILRTEHYDISKVVISTANANITSPELAERLRKEYHLEMEMTGGTYVLAMTTVADTQEGLDRLKAALLEIDGQLEAKTAVSGSIEISGELLDWSSILHRRRQQTGKKTEKQKRFRGKKVKDTFLWNMHISTHREARLSYPESGSAGKQ